MCSDILGKVAMFLKKTQYEQYPIMSQPILDNSSILIQPYSCLSTLMSTESLNRTSEIVETPSQYVETPKRVNVDVLKQRLLEEKKKEKVKRTIILSSVIVSLGALTMLTY